MDVYEKELRSKWQSINASYKDNTNSSLKLPFNHKLEWHVGYLTRDFKSLIILCRSKASRIESSKSIEAACNRRRDGLYAISFTLLKKEQEDVFITMCADLIRYSSDAADETSALKKVLERYREWLKLLDHKSSAFMGENSQKGLIGELLFLKDELQTMPPLKALEGWLGPEGADQDFVYPDGWHEIKTIGKSGTEADITSVEQLDNPAEGELVVTRLEKCNSMESTSFTLNQLIRAIRISQEECPDFADQFTLKLASAGYIQMSEYDKIYWKHFSTQAYRVTKDFPCIRRGDLPDSVINADYRISLPSIADWRKG